MAGSFARELLGGLLASLSPLRCPGCDLESDHEAGFCPACAPLIEPAPDGLAVLSYGGPVADAIARFKYGGRTDLAAPLGQLLADGALAYAGQVDCVVPLPLFERRLRERGFNQSALLSECVARALGVPLEASVLQRTRDTPAQAGLSRALRIPNVRGAFSAIPCERRVLLIDDVRTTGATLAAAASALRSAGCPEVIELALAAAEG